MCFLSFQEQSLAKLCLVSCLHGLLTLRKVMAFLEEGGVNMGKAARFVVLGPKGRKDLRATGNKLTQRHTRKMPVLRPLRRLVEAGGGTWTHSTQVWPEARLSGGWSGPAGSQAAGSFCPSTADALLTFPHVYASVL